MRVLAIRKFISVSLILISCHTANAADLIVNGEGLLTGATNVTVDGSLYDVVFLEGTCIEVFDGCDNSIEDFTFQGPEAVLAAQALIDQVFIDGPLGLFDSSPSLTFGCNRPTASCSVFTPFALVLSTTTVGSSSALNRQNMELDSQGQSVFRVDNPLGVSFSSSATVWAKWSPASTSVSQPPSANAGSHQSVRVGDTVFLDGSTSFDDNTPTALLSYAWSFSSLPAGSGAVLLGGDTISPSFLVDVAGTYTIELVVTDEDGQASTPDEVIVSSDNLAPIADAGLDQLVFVGSTVFLDGSGSTDPEEDSLTYEWVISDAPPGTSASLMGADTALPNFLPDLEGKYEVTLVVSDFIGPGTPDSVNITVVSADQFAINSIVSASEFIISLEPAQVTTKGNQIALTNFLRQAITAIQSDDIEEAISKLENAIARTDGCILRGDVDLNGPERRDWIVDCAAQEVVYEQLNQALTAITPSEEARPSEDARKSEETSSASSLSWPLLLGLSILGILRSRIRRY